MKNSHTLVVTAASIVALSVAVVGCYKPNTPADQQAAVPVAHDEHDHDHDHDHGKSGHDHGGWWCPEHGVPEEICGLCSPKVAAELKAKGDWCMEHNRPKSQCFLCDPKLEQQFAALYEAKYGKAPPKPE